MKLKLLSIPVIFLSAIALMSFNGGGGDNKCKFDYEKVDKFTGKMVRVDNYTLERGVKLQLGDNSGQLYIGLGLTVGGDNLNSVLFTDTLFLKLEDKTVIAVIPNNEVKPTAAASPGVIITFYNPIYNLTKEQVTMMSKSKIIAMRYTVSGSPYNSDVSDKKAAKMMGTCSCLVQ